MASASTRVPLQRKLVDHRLRSSPSANNPKRSVGGAHNQRNLHVAASSSGLDRLTMDTYQGAIYYASMYIGDKAFVVIVDTGSTDLWISCSYYDKARCQSACPKAALVISYGSGDVCVTSEYQTVQLGSLLVRDYAVGVALGPNVQKGSNALLLGDAQGLLGLGYPDLATIVSPVGYFTDFLQRFSVYLAPDDSTDDSFLLLNEVDESLIKRNGLVPYSIPLKKETHWTLGMTSFQFDSTSDPFVPCTSPTSGSCDVIVDTGTTLLIVPPQVFDILANDFLIPAGCVESQEASILGMYICDTSTRIPTLTFTFDKLNFYLDMENYITRQRTAFLVEIQASSSSGSLGQKWVLGGTFLKQFYSSYEVNKAVVLYCQEGKTCDQNGTVVASTNSTKATSTPTSAGSGVGSVSGLVPGKTPVPGTAIASDSSSTVTSPPSGGDSVNVSTSSGGSNSHTLTITLIASLVGLAFVVLVVVAVRRWFSRRQMRQQDSQLEEGYEMETITTTEGAYSRAPLTPDVAKS